MKQAFLVIALACLTAFACSDQKEKPLNSEAKKRISQGYADTVRKITPLVDSLCTANRDALITQLTDSLYQVRFSDLNRQRKRFQQ